MPFITTQLYLHDSPLIVNRDILYFINKNIQNIITRGSVIIHYHLVGVKDAGSYLSKGIKNFPVMVLPNGSKLHGIDNILDFLRQRMLNPKNIAASKSEEEMIREYQQSTLGTVRKNADGKFEFPPDEEEDDQLDLSKRTEEERKKRASMMSKMKGGGGSGGGEVVNGGPMRMDDEPRKPSRDSEQDHDGENTDSRHGRRPNNLMGVRKGDHHIAVAQQSNMRRRLDQDGVPISDDHSLGRGGDDASIDRNDRRDISRAMQMTTMRGTNGDDEEGANLMEMYIKNKLGSEGGGGGGEW